MAATSTLRRSRASAVRPSTPTAANPSYESW